MTDQQPSSPDADPTTGEGRRIELEVEVPGTPEEVWEAVATGPGISSWFIPMDIEERAGGRVSMHWGPDFGDAGGEVVDWEPPRRVLFRGDDGAMAYEWLVEALEGGTCIVRLVNSGFGDGDEWDDQFHGMAEGWRLFLTNLRLQRTHFPGRSAAVTSIPTARVAGSIDGAWSRFCALLGTPDSSTEGDEVATADGAPPLRGRVVAQIRRPTVFADLLVLDAPAAGTAFLAAEGFGGSVGLSAYLYLYDGEVPADPAVADTWRSWFAEVLPPPPDPAP
jgi:uncharacterized protein YndB with AHSA1/START domain